MSPSYIRNGSCRGKRLQNFNGSDFSSAFGLSEPIKCMSSPRKNSRPSGWQKPETTPKVSSWKLWQGNFLQQYYVFLFTHRGFGFENVVQNKCFCIIFIAVNKNCQLRFASRLIEEWNSVNILEEFLERRRFQRPSKTIVSFVSWCNCRRQLAGKILCNRNKGQGLMKLWTILCCISSTLRSAIVGAWNEFSVQNIWDIFFVSIFRWGFCSTAPKSE